MKKLLVPALWIALVLTIAFSVKEAVRAIRETAVWEADTTRLFTQVELDRIVHDSTMAFQRRTDSVVERLAKVAERNARVASRARGRSDSLLGLLDSLSTPSDSAEVALGALETLRVGYDSLLVAFVALRGAYASQQMVVARLTVDNKTAWADIDSLQSLIRRTPTCRKIPLLGISVPKLGIGYFATTGGHGVGIGVMVPLSCR